MMRLAQSKHGFNGTTIVVSNTAVSREAGFYDFSVSDGRQTGGYYRYKTPSTIHRQSHLLTADIAIRPKNSSIVQRQRIERKIDYVGSSPITTTAVVVLWKAENTANMYTEINRHHVRGIYKLYGS